MGLLGQGSCPLHKEHLAVYGIHAPRKWTPEDCVECQYVVDSKCNYKQIIARQKQLMLRGRPVVVKKALLSNPPEKRHNAEADELKKAGFSADEQKEYWTVSAYYDRLWSEARPEQQRNVLDQLDELRTNLEKGLSPMAAEEGVKEWVKQREEWKKGS